MGHIKQPQTRLERFGVAIGFKMPYIDDDDEKPKCKPDVPKSDHPTDFNGDFFFKDDLRCRVRIR